MDSDRDNHKELIKNNKLILKNTKILIKTQQIFRSEKHKGFYERN